MPLQHWPAVCVMVLCFPRTITSFANVSYSVGRNPLFEIQIDDQDRCTGGSVAFQKVTEMPLDAIVNDTVIVEFPNLQDRRAHGPEEGCDRHVNRVVPYDGGRLLELQQEHGLAIRKALVRRFGAPPPDAEDAVQSAVLKFLELEGTEGVRNVRAFLFAMARNIMLDEIRRMKVREKFRASERMLASSTEVEECTPEFILMNRQRYTLLNEAIAMLPEEARHLIVLSRIENITYADISKRTGLSAAYISRSIQRSLRQLLVRLQEEGLESI